MVCRDVPLVHPLRSIASKKHGYWRRRTGRASLHVVQAISMSPILWPHISHFYALNGLLATRSELRLRPIGPMKRTQKAVLQVIVFYLTVLKHGEFKEKTLTKRSLFLLLKVGVFANHQ